MTARPGGTPNLTWRDAALPAPLVVGHGRLAVRLEIRALGRDLLVTVTGGQAHAGAIALAAPGMALPEGVNLLVLPPHREGPLARECAARLTEAAGCTCVVVAGIHIDEATPAEIATIVTNVRAGTDQLTRALAAVPAAQRYCSDRLPKPSTP